MAENAPFRSREIGVLNACYWAHSVVPNGHYLTSGRQQSAAARRLIERGMLTLADQQPAPTLPDCIVVYLTQENWAVVQSARGLAND